VVIIEIQHVKLPAEIQLCILRNLTGFVNRYRLSSIDLIM